MDNKIIGITGIIIVIIIVFVMGAAIEYVPRQIITDNFVECYEITSNMKWCVSKFLR